MDDLCYCLDLVVPERMSQVSRRSEVINHKQRTLNTRLSSDTSAGTFAMSAGPSVNYCTKAGTNIVYIDVYIHLMTITPNIYIYVCLL